MRTCIDCGEGYQLPVRGYGTSKRCKPCAVRARDARRARSLRTPRGRYFTARYSATDRGFAFDLSVEDYQSLVMQSCRYCGNPLNETGAGLDRLDDNGPYTVANVVPSCWPCNYLRRRGGFTFDEMMRLGPVLGPIWKVHPPRGTAGRGYH